MESGTEQINPYVLAIIIIGVVRGSTLIETAPGQAP